MRTGSRKRVAYVSAGLLGFLLTLWLSLFRPEPLAAPVPAPHVDASAAASSPRAIGSRTPRPPQPGVRGDYIVQASSLALARRAVEEVGGAVTGELEIIRAVGASLDARELAALETKDVPGLRVYADSAVRASSIGPSPDNYYPTEVRASSLQQGGVTGRGVTVAVLDTGIWSEKGPLQATSYGRNPRVLAQYDVILARENPQYYPSRLVDKYGADIDDFHGHGTHVSSVIASSGITQAGKYEGIAPGVNLVSVRVLDSTGAGRYFDVIRGIQWVVSNRAAFGIRVINLSLSGNPVSHYWEDPLDQAVMAAWGAGIVVVAAAGNNGPHPMTIGVPGNVPYIITVGAVTDNYKPLEPNQYSLASFSSAGPTYEGFVKPEVVSMGGHIRAYAPNDGTLATLYPSWVDNTYHDLTISGTSQAAAVTSGVVALILDANPALSPDDVKCRLMSGARPAVKSDGTLAYTVFQQGAGLVDASRAVYSTASGCANAGLNVALDVAGLQHYGGRANQDSDGNFYIMEVQSSGGLLGGVTGLLNGLPIVGTLLQGVESTLDGLLWNGLFPEPTAFQWSDSYTWSGGYTWSDSYTWNSGYTWSDSYTSSSNAPPDSVHSVTSPQE